MKRIISEAKAKSRCRRYLGSFIRGVLIVATVGGLACLLIVMGCNAHGVDSRQKIVDSSPLSKTEEPNTEDSFLECIERLSQEFTVLTNGQVVADSRDGDTAIILLGEKHGMKVGMQLGAYRRNHLVGKAIVEKVRENCSRIRIIEMKGSLNDLEFRPIE